MAKPKKIWLKISLLMIVAIICLLAVSFSNNSNSQRDMQSMIDQATNDIEPLSQVTDTNYPAETEDYFKFYGLNFNDVQHIFGTFKSQEQLLVGQLFKIKNPKGTIVILHGYFNHIGQLNLLIEYLTSKGFSVACFDLPGHGISSGERVAIDDFSQYSKSLASFMAEIKGILPGPYHFIGHSTGAIAVLDSLLGAEKVDFDKIILAAPLVHSVQWELSKIGSSEKISFITSIPRVFRKNSSDKAFLDFQKNKDPLQSKTLTLKWIRALYSWNEKIAELSASPKSLLVIQGDKDTTVDWQYNMSFIEEKFPNAEIKMIENARHELFNESSKLRKEVFAEIYRYLTCFGDTELKNGQKY